MKVHVLFLMHTKLNKYTYETSYNRKLLNIVVELMGL